jgi:succinate dehydrogenase / fumarate reductase cytochrome b subunit
MLHSLGPLLWVVRAILILFIFLHVWKGIQLKLENWAARPVKYAKNSTVQATLASRTMIWTGIVILAFLIYHILHYTARTTNPEFQNYFDSLGRVDVYHMVIVGFSNPVVSIFYIIAVGLACFHLTHAFSSMFQTVGLTTPKTLKRLEALGMALAIVLFLGFSSVPVAVLAKWVIYSPGGF